jgi:hypothetical protein
VLRIVFDGSKGLLALAVLLTEQFAVRVLVELQRRWWRRREVVARVRSAPAALLDEIP